VGEAAFMSGSDPHTIRWRAPTSQSRLFSLGFLAALVVGSLLFTLNLSIPLGPSSGIIGLNGWAMMAVAVGLGRASVALQIPSLERSPLTTNEHQRYRAIIVGRRLAFVSAILPIAALAWLSLGSNSASVRAYFAAGLVAYFLIIGAFLVWVDWRCRALLRLLRSPPAK
jgi:hypothetical protein